MRIRFWWLNNGFCFINNSNFSSFWRAEVQFITSNDYVIIFFRALLLTSFWLEFLCRKREKIRTSQQLNSKIFIFCFQNAVIVRMKRKRQIDGRCQRQSSAINDITLAHFSRYVCHLCRLSFIFHFLVRLKARRTTSATDLWPNVHSHSSERTWTEKKLCKKMVSTHN